MAPRNPQLFYEENGVIQILEFDVVRALGFEDTSEATEYPVEGGGSAITDSIRDLPKLVTIEGEVTNTPLLSNPGGLTEAELRPVTLELPPYPRFFPTPGQLTGAAVSGINNAIQGGARDPSKNQAWVYPRYKDRASEMHARITRLKKARVTFRYQSPFRSAENLHILSYSGPETPEDGELAVFSLTLKQIEMAEVLIVQTPQPAEKLGAVKKQAGSKSAGDDDPEKAKLKEGAVQKSLAATGVDAGFGSLKGALAGL